MRKLKLEAYGRDLKKWGESGGSELRILGDSDACTEVSMRVGSGRKIESKICMSQLLALPDKIRIDRLRALS